MSFYISARYNFFTLVYVVLSIVGNRILRRWRREFSVLDVLTIFMILPVTWVGQLAFLGQLAFPPYEARVGGASPRVVDDME